MKVAFPLSLKVTVWLLLNLLLLAVAAVAFLVVQGGVSWDSLVAGPAGDRLQALSIVVSGEAAAAAPARRDAVLARFSAVYGADFLLVENHGGRLAGPPLAVPADVQRKVDEGPLAPDRHGRLGPGALDPANDPLATPEDLGPPGTTPDHQETGNGPLHHRPGVQGRFLVHSGAGSWWIGVRVPFRAESMLPLPATLLLRASSFWGVIVLLNLEVWLLVAASVVVLSILFWLPLVHSITRQLRMLNVATERIADGRFDTRVAVNRRDELGRLGESVNAMASRLDTLVNGQKRFLADVAHELGSPIGRLQVATEILELRAGPELQESVRDVREEVQHMGELLGELLAFTKAGLKPRAADRVPVAVEPLFARVLTREDPAQRVQRTVADDLWVLADEALLTRAVGNLVRNALRYAGEAASVSLSARRSDGGILIVVEDTGPGVPAAALERLGEPFFRPELARTRETGGVGLGLAIVRSGVAACGGHLAFSNRQPHGFRAEIRLDPAAQPAASPAR